jgi:hypothetical protein
MFAHTMSSTALTATARTRSACRFGAIICSLMPSTSNRRMPDGSWLVSGPEVGLGRKASPMTLASSFAACMEIRSRSRAITFPPCFVRAGEPSLSGAQKSQFRIGKSKPSGMTPTTTKGVPSRNPASGPNVLSVMVRPTIPGSPWKYFCHAAELMTTVSASGAVTDSSVRRAVR